MDLSAAESSKPLNDGAGFYNHLALVLQVLFQRSGGNTVSGVWAWGVINPGTNKKAFLGCTTGPAHHASSCWATQMLLPMFPVNVCMPAIMQNLRLATLIRSVL